MRVCSAFSRLLGLDGEQQGQAHHPPRLRLPLRQRRARPHPPHLRPNHTHAPARADRLTSPTITPGEPLLVACLKTVCGLLNSPDGGTLVIGVLEVEREMERGEASRLLKWLADKFGYQVPKDSGGDLH